MNHPNESENLYFKGTAPHEGDKTLKTKEMEKNLLELLRGQQTQMDRVLTQQDELISIIKNLTSGKGHVSEVESEKKLRLGLLGQEFSELTSKK